MLLKVILIVAAIAIVFFIIKKCGCGCGAKRPRPEGRDSRGLGPEGSVPEGECGAKKDEKKDESGENKGGCCS